MGRDPADDAAAVHDPAAPFRPFGAGVGSVPMPAAFPIRPARQLSPTMPARVRILIVGAGPQAALARRLRGLGHAVCATAAPEHAVERAMERRPDLVLTRLDGAPPHAGVEAAERRGVPVVCLVGPAAGGDGDGLPRPGRLTVPVGFAFEPVDPGRLGLTIDAALAAGTRERATRDRERRETADLRRRVAALERELSITRTVFDALHQPVLALDPDRRFLMMNEAAQRVVGEPAPADHDAAFRNFHVYGMDGAPMAHEDQPLERAIRGEPFTDVEVMVKAPGQSEANVCISITGRPLRAPGGDLMGGVVVVQNVTRIKETEKRLHETIRDLNEQRELMNAVLDTLHEAVVAIDADGNLLVANRAALALEDGAPPDGGGGPPGAPDPPGRPAPEGGPPPDLRIDTAFVESRGYRHPEGGRMALGELPLSRVLRGERLDGVELTIPLPGRAEGRYVSVGGGPLRDDAGAVRAAVLVIRDVTHIRKREIELRRTSTALHERVQLTDAILRNMSDGVIVADGSARLTYMNDSIVRMVGIGRTDVPPGEWVAVYGVFHPDQVTPFAYEDLPLVRAIRGESSDHVEMFVRNVRVPQGIFLSVDARPLRNEAGEVSGGVAMVRDLSQTIAAREAFASGRLEVVDTVLHNIGNAMNSVTVGAGTLRAELRDKRLVDRLSALADAIAAQGGDPIPWLRDDPRGRKALPFLVALAGDVAARNDRLLRTADRMRDRVRHIEDIIRTQRSISAGRAEPQVVDLKREVADAVEVLQEMLTKRGIRVEVDCGRGPDRIRIHESRFHQMLVNLVRNAMEALDERAAAGGFEGAGQEPWIRIASWLDPEFVVIDVSDNGVGIDPGRRRSIFSAGYTTKESGSGLGLHSAANFVIGQGGRITPLSAGVGQGATLRVMLRRSTTLPAPPETPAEEG